MKLTLNKQIPKSIFRAYDIRGIVDETLTANTIYTIGMAIGTEAQERGQRQIIIARDGRLSGPDFIKALSAGLMATGCDVINIGAVPTPVLYFAAYTLNAQSGVMLTGSHNPANYNGLKIIINGETLSEQRIYDLYERIQAENFRMGEGKEETRDILPAYIDYIKNNVKLSGKPKVIVDCGNGITGKVAPDLFRQLGCEVTEMFCQVDGNFPNHHPDPSVAENLQDLINAVKKQQADIGLAFDGDGDRLGMVTEKGEIIWPDRQLILYAIDVLKNNAGATIIYDVKCSNLIGKLIEEHGGKPMMYKTGHSLIKAKLRECNALLAGEMSGHIFFKDRWFGFDDGLYVAARLLEIVTNSKKTVSALFADFPVSVNTQELKLTIAEDRKFGFMDEFKKRAQFPNAKITTIDGVRVDYDYGWGLLRPSNTSPCLVMRFEADTENHLKDIQDIFRKQLLALDKNLSLPF